MNPIIRVEHLRKVYRVGKEKVVALNDVSLSILPGEVCCIVGASGSGKSTLLNQLAGLEKPTRGRVLIGRHEISAMTENELAAFRQAHLGFIFQSYNLLPNLTAAENVALPLMFKGVPRKQRQKMAVEQLKLMGLAKRAGHKPTEMSGGQQQRVGIARAFVTRPKVIFADEPTGNLDTKTTRQVLRNVLRLLKLDPEIALNRATDKFTARFAEMERLILADGKKLADMTLEEMVQAWNRAKETQRNANVQEDKKHE